jgi:hypothetical protein
MDPSISAPGASEDQLASRRKVLENKSQGWQKGGNKDGPSSRKGQEECVSLKYSQSLILDHSSSLHKHSSQN